MSNELRAFTKEEFGTVRTMIIDGKPYFCARDVATALGYSNQRNAVKRHCKNIVKQSIETKGGNQEMTLINIEDTILLIQKSKAKSAKSKERFGDWILNLFGLKPNMIVLESREEIEFFDKLEEMFETMNIKKGIKQYDVLGKYKIDYYMPDFKLAIEYDENGHSGYTYEQHEGRQKEIEKELCCKFVRLDNRDDIFVNIAKVFKVILNR
ncbi:MAG: Bro-N domain-containing protein [Erysipelotrichaceae bacterium]|nr:Bro-N domain-containing protein [Erysipelotrichaceae bacterium]